MAQHCPECGFANDDGAAYCQRCGAFLAHSEPPPGVTTATYKVDESGELEVVELQDVIAGGEDIFSGDVARLTEILAGRAARDADADAE